MKIKIHSELLDAFRFSPPRVKQDGLVYDDQGLVHGFWMTKQQQLVRLGLSETDQAVSGAF